MGRDFVVFVGVVVVVVVGMLAVVGAIAVLFRWSVDRRSRGSDSELSDRTKTTEVASEVGLASTLFFVACWLMCFLVESHFPLICSILPCIRTPVSAVRPDFLKLLPMTERIVGVLICCEALFQTNRSWKFRLVIVFSNTCYPVVAVLLFDVSFGFGCWNLNLFL